MTMGHENIMFEKLSARFNPLCTTDEIHFLKDYGTPSIVEPSKTYKMW